jgi:uncharacterized membrane-anchored protein YjiN (DUF445 family)
MLLVNLFTEFTLSLVLFGGLVFASDSGEVGQTDYLESYFETVNKSEALNSSIMKINSNDLNVLPEENNPEREKFISKLNLRDDIRMAQDEFFQSEILTRFSEKARKAFKKAYDEAISTLKKDESTTKSSDYNNASEKLVKAMDS